jgi:Family of unknown function (DUF6502)
MESNGASSTKARIVATRALLRLFNPVVQFGFDSGMSIHELTSVLREAAVRSVATQQLEVSHRINISGIAATTGIPRAEISRILKAKPSSTRQDTNRHQQATNRVLAIWCQDQRYTTSVGQPAVLKIYGRGATFESLAKKHGHGIPTRAILDELVRRGAVEVRSAQTVHFRALRAVDQKSIWRAIENFGIRGAKLLSVMLSGVRHPANFVIIDLGSRISPDKISEFRKAASAATFNLFADIESTLKKAEKGKILLGSSSIANRVVATIIIHRVSAKSKRPVLANRRNLRRAT